MLLALNEHVLHVVVAAGNRDLAVRVVAEVDVLVAELHAVLVDAAGKADDAIHGVDGASLDDDLVGIITLERLPENVLESDLFREPGTDTCI